MADRNNDESGHYQRQLPLSVLTRKNRRKPLNVYYKTDDDSADSDYDVDVCSSGSSAGSDWMKEHCLQQKTSSTRFSKPTQDFADEPGKIRRNMRKSTETATAPTPTDGIHNAVSPMFPLGRGRGRPKRKVENSLGKSAEAQAHHGRQCYWIDCVNAARPDSKYCSDECGVKLATERITTILPGRLEEWNSSSCVAEQKYHDRLAAIQFKLDKYKKQYDDLENKHQCLKRFIEATSKIPYDITNDCSEDLTAPGQEGIVTCVLCGVPTAIKNYVRHIESCFIKTEKKVIFETHQPTHILNTNLFCNTYNKHTGQYCSRLAVNCPDHCKRQQFPDDVICGAPLSWHHLLDMENICRASKSKCCWHHNWERMRQAEIDIQKMEIFIELRECNDQKEKLLQQMGARGGLLNLLLNSTKTALGEGNESSTESA